MERLNLQRISNPDRDVEPDEGSRTARALLVLDPLIAAAKGMIDALKRPT